jgi:hypothetical protein
LSVFAAYEQLVVKTAEQMLRELFGVFFCVFFIVSARAKLLDYTFFSIG